MVAVDALVSSRDVGGSVVRPLAARAKGLVFKAPVTHEHLEIISCGLRYESGLGLVDL